MIELGIRRCQDWFEGTFRACVAKLVVPFLSHLLCLPLKFSFVCHAVRSG